MNFVCGDNFKSFCDFSFDKERVIENTTKNKFFKEPLVFIKTDYIFQVIQKVLEKPARIITHNSDLCIDSRHASILENPNLIHWFAQNINIKHPKLSSIPIGIANPEWSHGDQSIIKKTIKKENAKTNLVYANFTINTNPRERNLCLESLKRNGFKFTNNLPFEEYLNDLSSSMFSISPNGNGIDCHKTWESLYLKTIPIVTKSINSEQYSNLPILIVDNWNDLSKIDLSENLYRSMMSGFDQYQLNPERFLKF